MKFGIGVPICHAGVYLPSPFAKPTEIAEFTKKAEDLGFYSAWGLDHLAPTKDRMGDPQDAPVWYEFLTSFAYLAGVTSRIKFGAAVLVPIYREIVTLAKQLSTLDVLSEGRLLLGIGLGGHRDEFEAVRQKERTAHRGRMFLECIEALNLLLSQDNVNFNGEYYEFHDISLNPKPVQQPMPFYITGKIPDTPRRVAKYGAGYLLSRMDTTSIQKRIENLIPFLEEYGRDASDVDIAISRGFSIGKTYEEAEERFYKSMLPDRMNLMATKSGISGRSTAQRILDQNLVGTAEQIADQVNELKQSGIQHCILLYHAVDSYQEMVEQTQWFAEDVMKNFS